MATQSQVPPGSPTLPQDQGDPPPTPIGGGGSSTGHNPPPREGGGGTAPHKISKTFHSDQEAWCETDGCPAGPWIGRNALAVAARHTKHHGHPTRASLASLVVITRDTPEQVA